MTFVKKKKKKDSIFFFWISGAHFISLRSSKAYVDENFDRPNFFSRRVSPHLEQIGQHDERLLSDDSFIISQTGWDVGDVEIHNVGVPNTQVAHDHHHIIAHSNFCANL